MAFQGPDAAMALVNRHDEEGLEEGQQELAPLCAPGAAEGRRWRRRGLRAAIASASGGLALILLLWCTAGRTAGRPRRAGRTTPVIDEFQARQLQLKNLTSGHMMESMRKEWKSLSKQFAGRWSRAMEGEWDREAENTTEDWTQRMHKKWSAIFNRDSHKWSDIVHGEWNKALENASGWEQRSEDRWDQHLENSSKFTQKMDNWWHNLEKSEEFQETVNREKMWRQRLQLGLKHRLGDFANESSQINKDMLKEQMKHALKQGWSSVSNISAKANEWRHDVKSLTKRVVFLNGSSTTQCPDLDGLYIEKVLHSNLGGHGPDKGEESIVFVSNHSKGGVTVKRLAFKITATSPYSPGWTQMNGLSHGLVGKYGQVTIKPGTSVTLKIRTFDLESGELVDMPTAAFTFFDLDEDKGHEASEFITVGSFDSYELTNDTEVTKTHNADGTVTFKASTQGTFDDNPVDPLLLTEQQKNRAVTVRFSNAKEVTVTIGATVAPSDPGTWRCFIFVAHPVLKCAKTLGETSATGPSDLALLVAGIVCLTLAAFIGCLCCCL
mmetsp:Transcript_81375/g.239018  ORF Transcript_81375/g.239018 Transcript_81375/m.239018 type:complete len:552 (-) Transcript_81375:272-1927(-)